MARGEWVRVLPGVFRTASTPESWPQKLVAACLWGGADAVVSHRTAAAVHGLEGVPAPRYPIELTVPFEAKMRARGLVVHRSRRLGRADRIVMDGVPVTGLARTLVDLAPVLDQKHLAVALDAGLARHPGIDVSMLRRALRRLKTKGRPRVRALERLLDERAPHVRLDSALERRFSVAVRQSGLPPPMEHYDVVHEGRRIAELDFAYPLERLGIQLNGAGVHRRYAVWERDQAQLSELAAIGWRVVNVTWSQLETSEAAVLDRVARALRRTRSD